MLGEVKAMVSRTGYTGEDGLKYSGFRISRIFMENILSAGEKEGLVPAGLGARDTLRFEAALPLYGP